VSNFTRVGLEALLTPDSCVLVLIDHQLFQFAKVNSHEPWEMQLLNANQVKGV